MQRKIFTMTGSKGKTILKRLILLLVSCIISLLFLELFLQIYNPVETRVKGDKIVLPANKVYNFYNDKISNADKHIVHTKNAIGFRGEDIPSEGLYNCLSVIIIGGSTTECFYLSDGKDWPSLLGKKVAQDFKNVWFNNAGLDGHSTYGHNILIKENIAKIKPKLVIFLVGMNDVSREVKDDEHTAQNFKGRIVLSSLEGFIKSLSAYSEIANITLTIYRSFRAKMLGLPHHDIDFTKLEKIDYPEHNIPKVLAEHEKKFLPGYYQRLRTLLEQTREEGIDPILITQPALYGNAIDDVTGIDLAEIKVENISGDTKWKILELYNDVTRKVGEEEGVLVIDLAHDLPKSTRFFYDFMHFSNDGAEAVAETIYPHLKLYLMTKYREFYKQ